ncbi:MAG TPA: hypothetical protein VF804_01735 [Holophagaceae bacterium]
MDISAAGALAAFTYQTYLRTGTPGQALQQAFAAASTAGAQTAQLAGSGSDTTLLGLSTQAPTSLATYQVASQAGLGASAVQSLLAASPSADMLLAAGMNAGSQAFPVADPNTTAAWSVFQYTLAQQAGPASAAAYAQQAAATVQGSGSVNLLA